MPARLTLEDAHAAASARGGKCLDIVYKNSSTMMRWECGACRNIWPASLASIRNQGTWCRPCGNKNHALTIDDAKRVAAEKGGECLSTVYENNYSDLLWRCGKHGTEWWMALTHIKDKTQWCPDCSRNPKLTIADARAVAKERGGLCLSTAYLNASTHLVWQCGRCGGDWPATLSCIRNGGSWCPYCRNKNELATRELLEEMTGHKFPHKTGLFEKNKLWEIDGYCPELGLAFEYNGKQHYEYVPHFHKNGVDDLKWQKVRDAYITKQSLELDIPVYILVIPYTYTNEERYLYIRRELWFLGVLLPEYSFKDDIIPPFTGSEP